MTYKSDGTKVIHIDGLPLVSNEPEFKGEIILRPETHPVYNGMFPITILWRYKISKDGKDLLRYSWQGKYKLLFDRDNKHPFLEVLAWIDHTHMVCCSDWELEIDGSDIEGRRLPMLSLEDKSATVSEIINLAQSFQLI